MTKVRCEIDAVEIENDNGYLVDGVCATCPICGHEEESFGTGGKSVLRCLVLLRENCPNNQHNFYTEAGDSQ